jgi:vancomycin resistance protein YoaR
VSFDAAALGGVFDRIGRQVVELPADARFTWNGSELSLLRESHEGRRLDRDALQQLVQQAIATDERVVALPMAITRPTVATSDGPRLGIRELIQEGRTTFTGSVPEKQHNIRLASSRLNGVVVPPGATFSFNREVGPTTLDAGFQTGWGITVSGGGGHQTVPSVAGGICQVATTLFQPVFHAGYAIEERNYHLYWIPAYGQAPLGMKGLDATVDEEYGLDFKFINPTSDYLLIQSRVEGTTLFFGLYGTKPDWTVKIDSPAITNAIRANQEIVRRPEASMPVGRSLAVEGAQDGFDVVVTRTVTRGDDVRVLPLKSHYVPSQNVVLYGTRPA